MARKEFPVTTEASRLLAELTKDIPENNLDLRRMVRDKVLLGQLLGHDIQRNKKYISYK
jgi:hypothetical protein